MARTRKIRTPDGREADATVMPYRVSQENFNEYMCDDQTVIRLKIVVTEVLRVEGEYDNAGNPVYIVNSQPVVSIDPPDELRRKG